jgi:hypothetical protein
MAVNLLGLVVILFRRDVIWAIAATWICISIWTASPKPAPVFVRLFLFLFPIVDTPADLGRAVHGVPPARVDISAHLRPARPSPRTHRVTHRRRTRPATTRTTVADPATTRPGVGARTEAGATRSTGGRRRGRLECLIRFFSISHHFRRSVRSRSITVCIISPGSKHCACETWANQWFTVAQKSNNPLANQYVNATVAFVYKVSTGTCDNHSPLSSYHDRSCTPRGVPVHESETSRDINIACVFPGCTLEWTM